MSKKALVICSNDNKDKTMRTDSFDFTKQASDVLGSTWKKEWDVTFISPRISRENATHIRGIFPKDAPRKKFDLVWFCGCDDVRTENGPILVTNKVKALLRKHGVVLFTDMRGVFEHKHNIEINNGWILDVRAHVEYAKQHKAEMKEWLKEDPYNTTARNFLKEASNAYTETRGLVTTFLQSFKRTSHGHYIVNV